MRYGIFKAECEVCTKNVERDRLTANLWQVVERDENTKIIAGYDDEQQALDALGKFKSSEHITESFYGGYCIEYEVYFAAETELMDDERAEDLNAYAYGDGIEVAPIAQYCYESATIPDSWE